MTALPFRTVLFFSTIVLLSLSSFGQQLINQRQITLLSKQKRPNDFWPRSDGHVVLGEPGSPLLQKGYYEPGGSFSPCPGSFGLSIWVYDPSMNIVTTSDSIPLSKIQQEYVYEGDDKIPSLKAQTPYYTCTWKFVDHGKWQLSLHNLDSTK